MAQNLGRRPKMQPPPSYLVAMREQGCLDAVSCRTQGTDISVCLSVHLLATAAQTLTGVAGPLVCSRLSVTRQVCYALSPSICTLDKAGAVARPAMEALRYMLLELQQLEPVRQAFPSFAVHFDRDLPMSHLFLSRNIEDGNARTGGLARGAAHHLPPGACRLPLPRLAQRVSCCCVVPSSLQNLERWCFVSHRGSPRGIPTPRLASTHKRYWLSLAARGIQELGSDEQGSTIPLRETIHW
jgi:hypothetical protein